MYLLIFVVFTIVASSYRNSFLKSIAEMWGCSKIPHCITNVCMPNSSEYGMSNLNQDLGLQNQMDIYKGQIG